VLVLALRTLLWPNAERERLTDRLERMLADLERQFGRTRTLSERLALLRRTFEHGLTFVLLQFVPRFGLGMAAYNVLSRLAASLPDGTPDVRVMMRGVPHNVTTEMDLALWRATEAIRADRKARDALRGREGTALADD
jgi:pyruvate,water dikinase